MSKQCLGLLIITLLSWVSSHCQTKICGVVLDSINKPIPYVQIILKPSEGKTAINFTQSNNKGEYCLQTKSGGEFLLEFRAISFRTVVYPLTIIESEREQEIIINPILKTQPLSIKEVTLMGQRPITIKRDTVIFKTSAFIKGDEKVAEDILKRLPGISVSENGAITWQGKEIEKVMVEGDDLFGKGYRLVSRNLHANVIDKVEVYERYSHNSLLKDIEYSNRVALNLTLREDVRLTFFGNTSLGYTSNNTHAVRGNVMSLGKTEKFYFFGNSNRVGMSPTGDIEHFINIQNTDNQIESPLLSIPKSNLISLKGYNPSLKEQRVRNNNSNMLSFNSIINPTKKLTLKIVSFATSEHDNFFNQSYQLYKLPNSTFQNIESHDLLNKTNNYFGKLDLKYDETNSYNLEYQGKILKQSSNNKANHLFNQLPSNENLKNTATSTSHNIAFTRRISKQTAIVAFAQYNFENKPEEYYISKFTLESLFPEIDNGKGMQQFINNKNQMVIAEAKALFRAGDKHIINTKTGLFLSSNSLSTIYNVKLEDSSSFTPSNSYTNKFDFLGIDNYLGFNITRVFKNIFFLNMSMDFHWLYIKRSFDSKPPIKSNTPFIEPKLGIQWQIGKSNKIQAIYAYNASASSISEMMNGSILISSRTMQKGEGLFSLQRAHTSMISHTLGKVTDIVQLNTSVLLSTSKKSFAEDINIYPDYTIGSLRPSNSSFVSIFSSAADLFIKPIRSNLKTKGSLNYNNNSRFVNSILYNVSRYGYSYGGELRSALKGIINYHYGITWTQTNYSSPTINSNTNNYQFLDIYLKISPSINASVNTERYSFGNITSPNNPWVFIDFSVIYNYKPNKISISAFANNLLNNNEFGSILISEISEAGTLFRIVPRHFMLSVDVRF